jgi:hypothetical protein
MGKRINPGGPSILWTPEEDEILRASCRSILRLATYCKLHLPGRTADAARARLERLGLGTRERAGEASVGVVDFHAVRARETAKNGSHNLLRAMEAYYRRRDQAHRRVRGA